MYTYTSHFSTDNGSTWSSLIIVENQTQTFSPRGQTIAITDDGNTAFMLGGDSIYKTTNSGESWSSVYTLSVGQLVGFYSIACSSDGSKIFASGPNGILLRSLNGGSSWNATSNDESSYVAVSSDGMKVVTAGDTNGDIYKSINGGDDWTLILGGSLGWGGVAISDDGQKIVALEQIGQIYVSSNGGSSWTTRDSNRSWYSLAGSRDGTKFIASVNGTPANYISLNGGNDWTGQTDPNLNNGFYSLALSKNGNKFLSSLSGSPTRIAWSDNGSNWNNNISPAFLEGIAVSADGSKILGWSRSYEEISTPTPTPTNTPTNSVTPTLTPTNSVTQTETPTNTPTNSVTTTTTPTVTPTITTTSTPTPSITKTPRPTRVRDPRDNYIKCCPVAPDCGGPCGTDIGCSSLIALQNAPSYQISANGLSLEQARSQCEEAGGWFSQTNPNDAYWYCDRFLPIKVNLANYEPCVDPLSLLLPAPWSPQSYSASNVYLDPSNGICCDGVCYLGNTCPP